MYADYISSPADLIPQRAYWQARLLETVDNPTVPPVSITLDARPTLDWVLRQRPADEADSWMPAIGHPDAQPQPQLSRHRQKHIINKLVPLIRRLDVEPVALPDPEEPTAEHVRWEAVHGTSGDDIDVDRYIDGRADCIVSQRKTRQTHRHALNLLIDAQVIYNERKHTDISYALDQMLPVIANAEADGRPVRILAVYSKGTDWRDASHNIVRVRSIITLVLKDWLSPLSPALLSTIRSNYVSNRMSCALGSMVIGGYDETCSYAQHITLAPGLIEGLDSIEPEDVIVYRKRYINHDQA